MVLVEKGYCYSVKHHCTAYQAGRSGRSKHKQQLHGSKTEVYPDNH